MAEGRQMGGRAEQNDGRRRRRAFPRWHLFAILSSTTALGLCLSLRFWGQPASRLLPTAAAADSLFDLVVAGGRGRMLGRHGEAAREVPKSEQVYLCIDRKEKADDGHHIWRNLINEKFYDELKNVDSMSERTVDFKVRRHLYTVQILDITPSRKRRVGVFKAIHDIAKSKYEAHPVVIVATDSDEILSSIMLEFVDERMDSFAFATVPLTQNGTGFSRVLECSETLDRIFGFEANQFVIKDKKTWAKYVNEKQKVDYCTLGIGIDYKNDGKILNEKMEADDSSREGLANYWDYAKVEPSDERKWFPLLVGAQLKAESDEDDRREMAKHFDDLADLSFDYSQNIEIEIEEEQNVLPGDKDKNDIKRLTKEKTMKEMGILKSGFVNNVETWIWLPYANSLRAFDEDDEFQKLSGWMAELKKKHLTDNRFHARMRFIPTHKDYNVVVKVDGRKLFVFKPTQLLLAGIYSIKVVTFGAIAESDNDLVNTYDEIGPKLDRLDINREKRGSD
eukprot:GHVS01034477.1.p1 GENE.GHVS01034477.1~~GHVS01034477.1.p1  ORF type:complete len:507 (+),score=66.08 GHVS01034477.1:47-1567(+)